MPQKKIILALQEIQALKQTLETRMLKALTPVYDLRDTQRTRPIHETNIATRATTLASELQIAQPFDYPVLLSVMHGALPFASLIQQNLIKLAYPFQYEAIQVQSYQGTQSTDTHIFSHQKISLSGRHVIIIDDVCDTGRTYLALKRYLMQENVLTIRLMVLVDKTQIRLSPEASPDYVGFMIPKEHFVVGYGMDIDELLRNISYIGVVDPQTLPTDDERTCLRQEKILVQQLKTMRALDETWSTSNRDQYCLFSNKHTLSSQHLELSHTL